MAHIMFVITTIFMLYCFAKFFAVALKLMRPALFVIGMVLIFSWILSMTLIFSA